MSIVNEILQEAAQRAEQAGLPYSGAMTPLQAYQVLQNRPEARLVDVRSQAEWQFTGTVPNSVLIELKSFPGMVDNPHFLEQLKHQVDTEATVLFMCRSGARSDQAARLAAAHGYAQVYNVLEGFEGERDREGHRNNVNGWRASGLPWGQS